MKTEAVCASLQLLRVKQEWQEQSTGLVCAGTGRSYHHSPGLGAELFTLRFGPLLYKSVCWEVFYWGPRQTRNLTPGEVRPHPDFGSSDLGCFLHPEGKDTMSLEHPREEAQRGKWPRQSMALSVCPLHPQRLPNWNSPGLS